MDETSINNQVRRKKRILFEVYNLRDSYNASIRRKEDDLSGQAGIPIFEDLWLMCRGFPCGTSGKEPAWQCRRHKRHGFSP